MRMLDLNGYRGLMVLISIVNMTSALLIIMLERRSQVGVWKALGMTDQAVVRTFMWHATRILGQGFAVGNVLALTLVAIQSTWQCVPLDPEAYYVDAVPSCSMCRAWQAWSCWPLGCAWWPCCCLRSERPHPSLTNFAHVMSQDPTRSFSAQIERFTSTPRGISSPSRPSMWPTCGGRRRTLR